MEMTKSSNHSTSNVFWYNGYSYDPTRKLNKNQKLGRVTTNADTTKLNTQHSPVPYNVNFELNVFVAKSMMVYKS